MDIIEIFERFPTEHDCFRYLEHVRWPQTPICPYCQSDKASAIKKEHRYHCNTCNTSFSVTVRTIFHRTHLPLQKWFLAVSIVLNAKKGISARQLARHIRVNRNTAWRMGMQIRRAMQEQRQRKLLQGVVEMDETYIGGKPRRGNWPHKRGRGTKKHPVVGIIQRGGNIRAKPAPPDRKLSFGRLAAFLRENVDTKNATLITDEWLVYRGMGNILPHRTINHQKAYGIGNTHTNTIESFWAILKRGIAGQYHKVSIKHLSKYIDEFCYRFNNRRNGNVFEDTLARGLGIA